MFCIINFLNKNFYYAPLAKNLNSLKNNAKQDNLFFTIISLTII